MGQRCCAPAGAWLTIAGERSTPLSDSATGAERVTAHNPCAAAQVHVRPHARCGGAHRVEARSRVRGIEASRPGVLSKTRGVPIEQVHDGSGGGLVSGPTRPRSTARVNLMSTF